MYIYVYIYMYINIYAYIYIYIIIDLIFLKRLTLVSSWYLLNELSLILTQFRVLVTPSENGTPQS